MSTGPGTRRRGIAETSAAIEGAAVDRVMPTDHADPRPRAETLLADAARAFLRERHLATLSTLGRDGRIHSVPVGITYHDGIVRVIGSRGSQKFLNAERSGRASVNTVDGARWLSFEGPVRVLTDAESVAFAVELYAERYRRPRPNPRRVVLEMTVERVLGSTGMRAG